MSGESYVQFIINQLDGISVRGIEDMKRMLTAIQFLERLKEDVAKSRKENSEAKESEQTV